MSSVIERFVCRLDRIGIDVQLSANAPWVYLDSVNGIEVTELFKAEHGFTAFWLPVNVGQDIVFSDRRCEDDDGTLKPAIERVLENYMDSSKYEAWRRASAEKALQDMTTWQEENGLYGFIEEHVTRSYSGRQQNDDVEPKEKNI
jgi:hypothetical protein